MSAIDERAAHIRIFTVPDRAVGSSAVLQYAAVAADWERPRLQINPNPEPVLTDDEQFLAMSLSPRRLSAELGLKNLTITTGLVDTYSTPTLIGLVASRQLDTSPMKVLLTVPR
jgi:hypothetical protein